MNAVFIAISISAPIFHVCFISTVSYDGFRSVLIPWPEIAQKVPSFIYELHMLLAAVKLGPGSN